VYLKAVNPRMEDERRKTYGYKLAQGFYQRNKSAIKIRLVLNFDFML